MEELLASDYLNNLSWEIDVLVVVTMTLVGRFVLLRLLTVLGKRLEKTENVWDDALFEAARKPLSWLVLILGLLWALQISTAEIDSELFNSGNLSMARELSFVVLIAMFFVRFISLTEAHVLEKMKTADKAEHGSLDPTTLIALAKLFRLSVVISAVLVALPTMGIEITALLAFGGVGGIAVGFAAQDLLSNFFGGLMIYLDRPFAIGDWIRSPDREIEGTVETIGWRLTVVRTFDKRPLYIPNSVFNKLALENPSRMTNRRIKETIGIRYKDSAKMGSIIADVKKMLQAHEDIDTNLTLIVNFNSYASSSLEFFIYTFTKTTNWIRFHEVKQDVLLKIVEIVHRHDADFAFPTTTLDGLDVLRSEYAGPGPDAESEPVSNL